jgi:hypothetical protein
VWGFQRDLITPRGALEASLEEFLELVPGQTLRLVLLVLDKVIAKAVVVLVDDHSPDHENVGTPEDGGRALFVVFDVLFVQSLAFGPMHAGILRFMKK